MHHPRVGVPVRSSAERRHSNFAGFQYTAEGLLPDGVWWCA
jgi:hypothetical protein